MLSYEYTIKLDEIVSVFAESGILMASRCFLEGKMNTIKKNKKAVGLFFFGLAVFLIMLAYFTRLHALVLFDTDDWKYASYSRQAVPLWKNWNPTRVFPEIFMSLCYDFASAVFYPVSKDYLGAGTFMTALVVSVAVCVYLVTFVRLLRVRFQVEDSLSLGAGALFFLMHFWIFRSALTGNQHMFYSFDICCYYYYIIPNLLNCTLVMLAIIHFSPEKLVQEAGTGKRAILVLLMYLALFSNLYASIIFAVYLGWHLLGNLLCWIRGRKKNSGKPCAFRFWLRQNSVSLICLCLWAVVQIFEANGGRADSLKKNEGYLLLVRDTLKNAWALKGQVNRIFLLFCGLTVLLFLVMAAVKRREQGTRICEYKKFCLNNLVVSVIIFIYLVLICSKHYSEAIQRADILFGTLFFLLLSVVLLFCYVVTSIPQLKVLVPLFLVMVFYQINPSAQVVFRDSNIVGWTDQQCRYTTQKIIDQIIQADQNQQDSVVLTIPKFNDGDNWPITAGACGQISQTLRKQGVISHDINIEETNVIDIAQFREY